MSLRHNTGTKGSEEEVNRLCQLYPEIASWQPALITGAWNQWRAENPHLPAMPEKRDEAFPLYLVRLIRNRMEEMNAWR
ncbi:hypothetical protein ACOTXN_21950 [Enterobacter cloacae complex sp. IR53043]|uniref:Uncharacterized protein n=1 Tax=Enterobacter cloacae TaxID=550 RepID=A0AA42QYQ4_ENTCL|nr:MULTISPECIES: hypothetical protein [Enterobacteriaceae]ECY4131511.1 hypothetical protein [Salmonella enterica subsp. enterica serovar Infantis]EFS2924610.1 hypothetical protein [Salmonella enterica]EMB2215717.1 hypothetical protein [Enterobacter hormaechei subsp. hoffmannii]HAS0831049.1 hypothetical protein [Enterobacter cloacae subsp. cloacae]HCB2306093.1 hypothetical protein [Escherichia coli]HCM3688755.1 hypothetical protein [Salmonella enterica subsp. enterica serovar Anatum]